MFLETEQIASLLITAFVLGMGVGKLFARSGERSVTPPAAVALTEPSGEPEPAEPQLFSSPDAAPNDDLTEIIGLDAATADQLNAIGVYTVGQIAAWSTAHALWVEEKLNAPDRLRRERWIEQAITLRDASEAA